MHLADTSPHSSVQAKTKVHNTVQPKAGPPSQPSESTLLEWIEPATAAKAITDETPWQPNAVDLDDWSDEEVMMPRPAVSKR